MTKIILLANHQNGYNITSYLLSRKDAKIEKIIVISDQKNQWWPSVYKLAKKNKLPIHIYKSREALIKSLMKLDFDLIISANWRYKIPKELLSLCKLGAVNFHNSLLPKYRGAYANSWVLFNGETETGVTLHWMTENFDDGDIINQRTIPIYPEDTAKSLWDRMNVEFLKLFRDVWPNHKKWKMQSKKQTGKASYYSVKDYVNSNQIKLNKKMEIKQIINFLRSRSFFPYYNDAYFIDAKSRKKVFITAALITQK
jgi:methionyl-tRNA formyltransferase